VAVRGTTLSPVVFFHSNFSRILGIFQTICLGGQGYTKEVQNRELLDPR